MRSRLFTTALVALVALLAAAPARAQTIDTGLDPLDTGGLSIIPSSQAFFGQFFTVPTIEGGEQTSLTSFGFGVFPSSRMDVRFGIAEWLGGRRPRPASGFVSRDGLLYGATLHTSAPVTFEAAQEVRLFEYTFATPLNLTAGAMYLAFIDVRGPSSQTIGAMPTRRDVYPDGGSYFLASGGMVRYAIPNDHSFRATFGPEYVADVTTTPEPATLALVATGLVVVAGVARRRTRPE